VNGSDDSIVWDTFVMRVWHESSNGVWRGEIVHLPDRVSIHFASFTQAEEFMRRYVSGTEIGPPPDMTEASESADV
jgi:hypothetical protein